MSMILKAAALAVGLSFVGTAALACGPDGCGKDKDGKMECCCDKMKDHAAPAKPGEAKPAQPDQHKDHPHQD